MIICFSDMCIIKFYGSLEKQKLLLTLKLIKATFYSSKGAFIF